MEDKLPTQIGSGQLSCFLLEPLSNVSSSGLKGLPQFWGHCYNCHTSFFCLSLGLRRQNILLFCIDLSTSLPQPSASETELFYNWFYKMFACFVLRTPSTLLPQPPEFKSDILSLLLWQFFCCVDTTMLSVLRGLQLNSPSTFPTAHFSEQTKQRIKNFTTEKSPARTKPGGWPYRKYEGV